MLLKAQVYFILTLPFWLFFHNGGYSISENLIIIEHKVFINHPGEKGLVPAILVEVKNEENLPIQYYMDVESVICLEAVCKVIPVRLFWNNIGAYKKYELKARETLEKYEADLFEPQDYLKLQTILSNSNSPYSEVRLNDVLTVVNASNSDNVDAVSGATALVLDDKDTVPGAALTCFTLWHWANNKDIINQIKKISTLSASNAQILEFLEEENLTYYFMGLEALIHRGLYDRLFLDIIHNRVKNENKLIRPTVDYFETAPSEVYFKCIKELFIYGEVAQKTAAIKSLQNLESPISRDYLDCFSESKLQIESFQVLSYYLELMLEKNPDSLKITNYILPLLDENIVIARRVYWFLEHQQLNETQQKIVNYFAKNHKEQL